VPVKGLGVSILDLEEAEDDSWDLRTSRLLDYYSSEFGAKVVDRLAGNLRILF